MFFTQEDYRKIEKWLLSNSRKDTDFVGATTPLKGNETVVLVQNGKNVKTSVKDIVDQFFLLGVSDFLNITDKYGESYISLTQAIQLIPFRSRKEGQVITFLNTDGNWEIYQFIGKLNQWNNPTLWNNPLDWEKFIIDSILPDEEDLTKSPADANGNSYVSLKDREYNPNEFSGLGRVILRKNIVEIDDPIYGKVTKNILFQDMITQSNTIYEIRYDFDLNGVEITIPDGCTLHFQGGIMNNGSVSGNNTSIKATLNKIFDSNINLIGTWNIEETYAEWFGAVGDNTSDDTNALQKCIDFASNVHCVTKLLSKTYLVKNIKINSFTIIRGVNNSAYNGANNFIGTVIRSNSLEKAVLYADENNDSKNVVLSNFSIEGNNNINGINIDNRSWYWDISNVSVNHCNIGIFIGHAWHLKFSLTNTYYCVTGFEVCSATPITCTSFISCLCYAGDLGFNFRTDLNAVTLSSCGTDGCKKSMNIGACFGVSIIGYEFEQYSEYGIKVESMDAYLTFIGVSPRGYLVNEDVNELVSIKVIDCGGITFLSSYFSQGASPSNGYFFNVSDGCESKITFIDCNIYGDNNVNINNCRYIQKGKVLLHSTKTFAVRNDSTKAQTFKVDNEFIVFDNYNTDVTLTGTPIFDISNLIIGDHFYVMNFRAVPLKIPIGIEKGIECSNTAITLLTIPSFGIVKFVKMDVNLLGFSLENIQVFNGSTVFYNSLKNNFKDNEIGYNGFNTDEHIPIWWNGSYWVNSEGLSISILKSGVFSLKPSAENIYKGYQYFCTDKQTTEGTSDGIMIYHKGDNVWVDALGRVVS